MQCTPVVKHGSARRQRVIVAWPAVALVALFAVTSAHAAVTTHFPENDGGHDDMSFQGPGAIAGTPCPPPLGLISGASNGAVVGDEIPGTRRYVILSFDTGLWSAGNQFVLLLNELLTFGQPFDGSLGPGVVVELRTSSQPVPDIPVNPDEIEGTGYTAVGTFTAGDLYSAAGIDLSPEVQALLGGPHGRYLYVRFYFLICQNGNISEDITAFVVGPGEQGRARINELGASRSFSVNDDAAHEVGFQGRFAGVGELCEVPLGTLGGSFGNARIGDDPGGVNLYTVLSFDTLNWQTDDDFTLFLAEEDSFGQPFVDLAPTLKVELRDSAVQFPSRFVNPAEIEGGGYTDAGDFDRAGLYAATGIDLSTQVQSLLGASHERYLYVRFRMSICQDGDSDFDYTEVATGAGTPGRANILVPEPSAQALLLAAFAVLVGLRWFRAPI